MAKSVENAELEQPFAEFLMNHDSGRTHRVVTRELHTLIDRCLEVGGTGTLTVKVKIKPDNESDIGDRFEVEVDAGLLPDDSDTHLAQVAFDAEYGVPRAIRLTVTWPETDPPAGEQGTPARALTSAKDHQKEINHA